MLKFDDKSSSIGNIVLLPAGTLAAARIEVRELKLGKQNNTRYADCVFRLEGGEHDRRVIFTNVNDPTEQKYLPAGVVEHSEKGRQMGLNALARMFEACGMARAGDRASYDRLPTSFEESMRALNG
jgi:hypothetical protein